MAKDQGGKKAALTLLRDGGPGTVDTFSVQVNAWSLPAPDVEYYADTCSAMSVDGTPTLVFAQRGLEGTFINSVAVAMSPKRFRDMVESFDPVLAQMSVEDVTAGHAIKDAFVIGVTPENYKKFFASLIRGGTTADGAMMDFYRVAMGVADQFRNGIPPDLVRPCVRIFMNSSTMVHLFDIIKRQGLMP